MLVELVLSVDETASPLLSLLLLLLLVSSALTLQMLRNQLAIEESPPAEQASSQTPVTALENAVTAVFAQKQDVNAVVPNAASTAGGTQPPLAS